MRQENRVDEFDLPAIFGMLRRRLWLIIVIPLLAALVAGAVSIYVLQPVYSASATLWVIKQASSTIDYNTLLTNRNLVKTYAEVAKSRAVIDEVIQNENLSGLSAAALQAKLSVQPVRDTEIIELSVTDGDPARAAQIVNAVAAAFMDQLGNYIMLENVAMVDRAVVPTAPIKPRPVINTAIAAVLGSMAAVGLAFVLEYMDTTINTLDDLANALALPALGSIPRVDRARLITASRKARIKARAGTAPTATESEVSAE